MGRGRSNSGKTFLGVNTYGYKFSRMTDKKKIQRILNGYLNRKIELTQRKPGSIMYDVRAKGNKSLDIDEVRRSDDGIYGTNNKGEMQDFINENRELGYVKRDAALIKGEEYTRHKKNMGEESAKRILANDLARADERQRH